MTTENATTALPGLEANSSAGVLCQKPLDFTHFSGRQLPSFRGDNFFVEKAVFPTCDDLGD